VEQISSFFIYVIKEVRPLSTKTTKTAERGRTSKVVMKNKLFIFFSCIALVFFVGSFSAKAADRGPGEGCGESDKGICYSGSFSCPDGSSHWTGGEDCVSGYRCCKDDVSVGKGAVCGAGDKGTCMEASMATCPSGYSFVSGGEYNCSGVSLRCCAADAKTGSDDTKKEDDGGDKTPSPGEGGGTGDKVQPLGRIDIPENLGLPNNTIKGVLTNLLTWLLGIIGVLALMGFVISGIQYLLAYSNEELAETAKKNMTYSILGITVALAGFIIIQAINLALQGTLWF